MIDYIFSKLTEHKQKVTILIIALAALNAFIFWEIARAGVWNKNLQISFLSVGQGDSELVLLPGGVKMLIDGGPPNGYVLRELAEVLSPTDRYIDLVVLSHPQLDHFGGLIDVIKRYKVGAFLWNGREKGSPSAFADLEKALVKNGAKVVALSAKDKIRYAESVANVVSPTKTLLWSKDLNDSSIVLELDSMGMKTLFTGDVGKDAELFLSASINGRVDVLKVPHHGSKYSSSASLLKALSPIISIIEVGKNSYGHPTRETLGRLENINSSTYRTDQDGTITLIADGRTIKVFKK